MTAIRTTRQLVAALGLGAPQDPIDVTVIFPAYNEVENIPGCYDEIAPVLTAAKLDWEFIFVDDGSSDDTWDAIRLLSEKDSRIRGLRHRRNSGKAAALANGITYARGRIVAICDADLQYDALDVLRVIEQAGVGFEAVTAAKVLRKDPLSKRLPSKFFNVFVRRMTGVQLHDMNAGLKAFSYDAANELVRYGYGELHRFFMVILAVKGYSVHEVPVESRPRVAGTSKYGLERYLRGAMDFLTVFFLSGYLERPLHLFGGMGVFLVAAGTLPLLYVLASNLFSFPYPGGGTLFSLGALMVMSGVQFFGVGLVAEMVGNLEGAVRSKGKVSEVIGIERRSSRSSTAGVVVDRREIRDDLIRIEHEGDNRELRADMADVADDGDEIARNRRS
jgi:glycosyltransferase involved in cell wall biosynthesis